MAHGASTAQQPNARLSVLITESGMSHKRLAHRVNELITNAGRTSHYTHTSVANWCRRGMVPKWPTPQLICTALSETLGRPVELPDIGMVPGGRRESEAGLGFPRRQEDVVKEAAAYWSVVNRRQFLAGQSFAMSAFALPVTRWLVDPAERTAPRRGGASVGREDITELREAAEAARLWDSRYGGAAWESGSLTEYLYGRAVPLLRGSYSENVGRELFRATAEMGRLAGWTAFDAGRQHVAQRHFVQALRLAKAGGDADLGSYILSTMAMQALMCGFHSEAVDMAQGAFQRGRSIDPRVAGFAKLIEARAHARSGDARPASACLSDAERLQLRGVPGEGPSWIGFFTRSRVITDATEIFRDLGNPKATLAWHSMRQMPGDAFLRSRAVRLSVLASAHAQQGELERSIALGRESVEIFSRLKSARGMEYIRVYGRSLRPFRREPQVVEYLADVRRKARNLAVAA